MKKMSLFYIESYVFPGEVLTIEIVKRFKLVSQRKLSESVVFGELCGMWFAFRDDETRDVEILPVIINKNILSDDDESNLRGRIRDVLVALEDDGEKNKKYSLQDISQISSIDDVSLPYYSFQVTRVERSRDIPHISLSLCDQSLSNRIIAYLRENQADESETDTREQVPCML